MGKIEKYLNLKLRMQHLEFECERGQQGKVQDLLIPVLKNGVICFSTTAVSRLRPISALAGVKMGK